MQLLKKTKKKYDDCVKYRREHMTTTQKLNMLVGTPMNCASVMLTIATGTMIGILIVGLA